MAESEHDTYSLELQRCVDGELSKEECRTLLQQMDRTGTGWRDLALLFVEDRLIGSGCREFMTVPVAKPAVTPGVAKSRSAGTQQRVSWPLVVASLAVGALLPWGLSLRPLARQPAGQVAITKDAPEPVEAASMQVARSMPVPMGVDQPASRGNTSRTQPIMELNLVGNGGQDRIPIPVYSQERASEVLSGSEAVFPEEIQQLLRQQGLELERHRNWIEYPLEDGSRVVIPAVEFQVRNTLQ